MKSRIFKKFSKTITIAIVPFFSIVMFSAFVTAAVAPASLSSVSPRDAASGLPTG